MISKWTAALTALALAATATAPAPAFAQGHRSYHGSRGYSHGHYYHHGDAAVAAGAIGLVLGLAIGAALSDPPPPRPRCYDRYQRCAPASGYAPQGYAPPPPEGYNDKDPSYQGEYQGNVPDDRRADYDRDYDQAPPPEARAEANSCVRPTQQWDPYSGTYVWVNLRTC